MICVEPIMAFDSVSVLTYFEVKNIQIHSHPFY